MLRIFGLELAAATMFGVAVGGCASQSAAEVDDKAGDSFCEIYARASVEQHSSYQSNGCTFDANDVFPESSDAASAVLVWSSALGAHESQCNAYPDAHAWREIIERRYRILNEQCGVRLPPYLEHSDGLVEGSPDCAAWLFPDTGCKDAYGQEYSCFEGPFPGDTGSCGKRSGQGGLCYNAGFVFNDNSDCQDGLTCVLPADRGQRSDGTCQ